MKIAVEGCAHGELERIYDTIQGIEKAENIKVDLLLCCGDFQSTRNLEDLQTMAVPKKYQDICTFYKYYSGELIAPILTIFIGGNHEASNYLQELPYGGWVAPNIYYLGYAGVVRVNGIRIAGLSGIYKGHDFLRGRHEFAPYTDATRISVYHVRQLEVFRLKQLSGKVDICISHDWPRGIYNYGNKAQLVRFKPHFRDEVENNQLGSRPCEELLKQLKPTMWFAAHLHCKFAAVVPHEEDAEASDDMETDAEIVSHKNENYTKFLALDKCLPKRRFLQLFDFESLEHSDDEGVIRLEYDLEWLTILSLTNQLLNVKDSKYYMPGPRSAMQNERYNFTPTEEELQHVRQKFGNDLRIPQNFCRTVEPYNPSEVSDRFPPQPKAQINPQSTQFCDMLGMDDPVSLAMLIGGLELKHSTTLDNKDNTLTDTAELLAPSDQSSCFDSNTLKRKINLSTSLPKPVASEEVTESLLSTQEDNTGNPDELQLDNSSDDEKVDETKVIETPTPVVADNETGNAKPPIKKFRRRNLEMYKTNEEDDEQTEGKDTEQGT